MSARDQLPTTAQSLYDEVLCESLFHDRSLSDVVRRERGVADRADLDEVECALKADARTLGRSR